MLDQASKKLKCFEINKLIFEILWYIRKIFIRKIRDVIT